MALKKQPYTCTSCGAGQLKWLGRCPRCGEYGTVEETPTPAGGGASAGLRGGLEVGAVTRPARTVDKIDPGTATSHQPTGVAEFDRVLGGGIVPGQVVLLAGEPGVGKSTLLLAVAHTLAAGGKTVLYVSGEESAEQIALRARRVGAGGERLLVADETDLSAVLAHLEAETPDYLIVDSVQTLASPSLEGRAGGVAQVNEVTQALTRVVKGRRIGLVLVGQITKTSDLAGPMTLQHAVDTVLTFEGDRNSGLRLLRTVKNRYGPADEIACFEQTEAGIREVVDPSGLFASGRDTAAVGVAPTVAVEGRRPLVVEVQGLAVHTNAPNPRRGVSGLDSARAAMLVAVTERYGKVRLFDKDTFLATGGGLKVVEPAADLAVCAALYSAATGTPIPPDVVFVGEVALSGDVRRVPNVAQRAAEAARLGFGRMLVSDRADVGGVNVTAVTVNHLTGLFTALQGFADSMV